jgi:signal transduction histidine kinase
MRGIAHEIRNPLNTMSITLQLLEEDLAGVTEGSEEDNSVLTDVRRVRREVDRLERILSDFQRYARLQYRPEEVDIGALVSEILDFMEGEAARANVEIHRSVPAGITTTADPALLRQAFLNVIVNAFQAIGEGGRLSVQLEGGSDVVVSFTDTGDGMDEDARARIFEPYYSTKEDGTGLGLAVVKEVAEMHGGSAAVKSAQGDGATVTLSIPLVTQATAPE